MLMIYNSLPATVRAVNSRKVRLDPLSNAYLLMHTKTSNSNLLNEENFNIRTLTPPPPTTTNLKKLIPIASKCTVVGRSLYHHCCS
jgi:hypothetical protein